MLVHYFKTNEEAGSLYSIEDLLKVQLSGDDLSTFIHNWESVIAGLNHQPEETTLRDILLRQLRNSGKLKFDLVARSTTVPRKDLNSILTSILSSASRNS